ncbi:MAG TPA: NUDIX domain-containing protein, partial [Gemmatimonadaceae bacterium]
MPAARDQVPTWAQSYRAGDFPPYAYTADLLELAVDLESGSLHGLLVERGEAPYMHHMAWPGGFVDWTDQDAREAGLREVSEETGHAARPRFFETLDTYDENGRDPRQFAGHFDGERWIATGARIVSKAFVALFAEPSDQPLPAPGQDTRTARWESVYRYLPWEDLRSAEGRATRREIVRLLTDRWVRTSETREESLQRKRRLDTTFGAADLRHWNEERTAERFTLLMEAGVITEAHRDHWGEVRSRVKRHVLPGDSPLAFDHRRMLADALGRLRGKMKYTPSVIAALIGCEITAPAIHRVCEAVSGRPIHLANLRRALTETHALLQ